ncbi:CG12662, partial [Drosophila busckii]
YLDLMYTNWTDDRPRFVVNMTFSNVEGVASITTINEEIASPMMSLLISQQDFKEKPRIIYNVTTKLCAMQAIFNSVPIFKTLKDNMLRQSNYTFSCPLKTGVYVMTNMRANPKNPLLNMMYKRKRIFVVQGGMFEAPQHSNVDKQFHTLTTYYVTGRIVRKTC